MLVTVFHFRVYYGHCSNLFDSNRNNTENIQCTDECHQSLKQWNEPSSPYHKFANATCGYSERCLAYKQRFKRCVDKEIRPTLHKNYLLNGCVKFYQICKKDSKCNIELNKFNVECNDLINGNDCTPGCKEVLLYLESLKVGESPAGSCQCDGSMRDEGICLGIKRNIRNLCK